MRKEIQLYEYQKDMLRQIEDAFVTHQSVMVQMPTGTGKTVLISEVVKREERRVKNPCVWIVVHRRELVEQIKETLERRLGTSLDAEREKSNVIEVFSIQWLSRHYQELEERPSLIVIDEAHHAVAKTYEEVMNAYPNAKKLGMTATPCRLTKRGFTDMFEVLLCSHSIPKFIKEGYLSEFDYISLNPNSEDQKKIDGLEKRAADGDYNIAEMQEVLDCKPSIERLYQTIKDFASGKKGIVYAINIEHAEHIAEYYREQGLAAVAISSKTPKEERRRMIELFKEGSASDKPYCASLSLITTVGQDETPKEIQILVNVDLFGEGFDCPDVEFIQLARPTLSLAKYLQQVGRGLRKSGNKESCMLIDNVGLYRIFGLPTRKWDWKSMFEGRIIGNAMSRARMENSWTAPYLPVENEAQDDGLEVVITHSQLMETIKNKESAVSEKEVYPSLKAHYDRQSGLWGLRRGERMTAKPQYVEVCDTKGDWAAVRFKDHRMGIVDDSGEPRIRIDCYWKLKFLKEDIIAVTDNNGNEFYIDLKVNRTYKEKPAVVSFGSVELLRVGDVFLSRTKKPYATMRGLDINSIYFYGFYLKIPDYRAPKDCKLVDAVWSTLFDVFACLLEGDDEEVYWCCGHLADRSIVVMDGNGNSYHVEKGKKKQYIACNVPQPGEEDFDTVVGRLKEEAMRCAEKTYQQQQLEEEQKRQKHLEEIRDVLPFQMGLKWGLKLGERIVVPPKYRKILPPVGYYCAYEENACQWGVMALDGKVVVEARYQEVDIEYNGTVHLTIIPGKVKTIKL